MTNSGVSQDGTFGTLLERELIEGLRELSPKEQEDFVILAQSHFDVHRRQRAYVEAGMDKDTAIQTIKDELCHEIRQRLTV